MSGFDINKLKSISKTTMGVVSKKEERYAKDPRFWTIERDPKTGNGMALIRFLPNLSETELPWVQTYDYFLKSPSGAWYVEKSRRTLGEADPMREYIHSLWQKATTEEQKKKLRENYRERMQYVTNILVVNDPKRPENNGKVFLYKFGKKIFDKIIAKGNDEFGESVNVFDWTNGANLKLAVKTVDKFPNYDSSEFTQPCSIGSDADILRIADSMYDLNEFKDPANFKSYDELKAKVERVFGRGGASSAQAQFESAPSRPVSAVQSAPKNVFGVSETKANNAFEDTDLNFDDIYGSDEDLLK